jgi:hypothetical protein
MTFLKTSALFIGLAALGIACGSDSSSSPDAPIVSNGGSRGDAAVVPGTGGMTGTGGAVVPSNGGAVGGLDSGAGGSTVAIDGSIAGSTGTIDSGIDGTGGKTGGIDAGIDAGVPVTFPKDGHLKIINAATTGGLDVTGPTAVPYTTCK